MHPPFEETLEDHLTRVERYMRGCELLQFPRHPSPLRTQLAIFIRERAAGVVDEWIGLIAPVYTLLPKQIPEIRQNMYDALLRWAAHIENPHDIETYVYLREHARHGFISHSSPSRFLSGQTKVRLLIVQRLRAEYAKDRKQLVDMLNLLDQEFYERVLHITDLTLRARCKKGVESAT
ncbi:MAG: hypothetical protein EXR78_01395 [Deltaproteobacteria bacterium]|nr:hypothetical protein [Deltaproteobacteria bacterium]